MSRIDELIAQHCPDGVEYLPFTAVGKFSRGGGPQKKDFQDSGVGCIHYGQIYTYYGTAATVANKFVSEGVASKSRQAQPGDVVIAVTGENDDDLARGVAWLGSQPVAVSNHTLIFSSDLDPRYVSYFLRSSNFDKEKRRHIMGTKVRSISAGAFDKILIPVPPLEVQRAIVEVLDTFSKLEAELEAELEARKQQYEHYREQLLTPSTASQVKLLGEVVRIKNGKDHKHLDEGEIPVYGSGGIMRYADTASAQGPSVLIPRKGSLGNIFYVEGPFWNVDTIFNTEINDSVIEPKYLFHQLSTMKLGEMNQAGGVPSQTQSVLNRLRITVPPLDEQRRIVDVLDKFDALVNDLNVGLPAELAARRQQYEYYRDKLLTFKELEVAA